MDEKGRETSGVTRSSEDPAASTSGSKMHQDTGGARQESADASVPQPDDALNDDASGRRGRGRPRKYPPVDQQTDESAADTSATPELQNDADEEGLPEEGMASDTYKEAAKQSDGVSISPGSSGGSQDFAVLYQGMQILGEIVRSQNETQQQFLKVQTEFSNSVMDRMDMYRMEFAKLQSELSEKEKGRLRADYLNAQEKADQASDENRQLRAQLDATGKKLIRLNARVESVESENESLRRRLGDVRDGDSRGDAAAAEEMNLPRHDAASGRRTSAASQTASQSAAKAASSEPGWRERRRLRKLQKAREKFLKKIDRDARFSDEQVDIIHEAEKSGIPLEKLELMANPDTTAENMKALLQCLMGR